MPYLLTLMERKLSAIACMCACVCVWVNVCIRVHRRTWTCMRMFMYVITRVRSSLVFQYKQKSTLLTSKWVITARTTSLHSQKDTIPIHLCRLPYVQSRRLKSKDKFKALYTTYYRHMMMYIEFNNKPCHKVLFEGK